MMDDTIKKLFEVGKEEVPSSIPLFPLDNVLLLPFGKLPLNIFEERYVNMTLDSLKSHRMIGVIQPKNNNNELFTMGCIGKITSYIETPDYRIVLNLEGVCRFVLRERNLTPKGYYQASINCSDYLDDLSSMEPNIDRNSLIRKYSNFFKMKKLDIDKSVLGETSNLQLLSTLAMLAPFNKIDKQAILESPNLMERINTLNSILDLNTFQIVSDNGKNQLN
jgi:Lon protease-like protein